MTRGGGEMKRGSETTNQRSALAMKETSRKDFHVWSYQAHEQHQNRHVSEENRKRLAESWFKSGTIDAWRHLRMYRCLDPLLTSYPSAYWLTVGDGRNGADAHYIEQKKIRVLATDISDVLLAEARRRGFIKQYKKENVESFSFADESFDFVLCKESYHHFPRPMVALYEMLRVAEKGVVLIEPNESPVLLHPKAVVLKLVKEFLIRAGFGTRFGSRDTSLIDYGSDSYEEVGNYVYRVSEREVEKVALGLNLRNVAFKGINDSYVKGVEFEEARDTSKLFGRIRSDIQRMDRACRRGLSRHSHALLAAVILKHPIEPVLRRALHAGGYRVVDLAENPCWLKETCTDS